jgi:hypothetical protein
MDYKPTMASWRSGYAADCKSVYSGSNPDEASIKSRKSTLPHLRNRATSAHQFSQSKVRRIIDSGEQNKSFQIAAIFSVRIR